MKQKIKRYIDCYVPITTCNLRCSYCYVAQQGLLSKQYPILNILPRRFDKLYQCKNWVGFVC